MAWGHCGWREGNEAVSQEIERNALKRLLKKAKLNIYSRHCFMNTLSIFFTFDLAYALLRRVCIYKLSR